jgi:hypothetical protein
MENKELILKDLCGRLPYDTLVYAQNDNDWYESVICTQVIRDLINEDYVIKPYLFPLSSMTEEQEKELEEIDSEFYSLICWDGDIYVSMNIRSYDWLNKNHFDYRGLIPMSLAIDATNLNIY